MSKSLPHVLSPSSVRFRITPSHSEEMARPAGDPELAKSKTSGLAHTTGVCSCEPPWILGKPDGEEDNTVMAAWVTSSVSSMTHELSSGTTAESEFSKQIRSRFERNPHNRRHLSPLHDPVDSAWWSSVLTPVPLCPHQFSAHCPAEGTWHSQSLREVDITYKHCSTHPHSHQ